MTARVVGAPEAQGCATWTPPAMQRGTAPPAALTPAELDELRERARAEGWEAGRRAGVEAGRREVQDAVARLDAVMQALARPLSGVEADVEHELVALALALARQLVRRELRSDPAQVVGVVRDALQALPVSARDVKVHLHPEDAELVVQHLPSVGQERAWTVVEDPMMTRGGARIASASSQVDARLETRLGALAAELLGGGRESERDAGPDGGER